MNLKEKETIQALAKQLAEIAALPIQKKTIDQWKKLNSLKPERPMFTIDQVCWNEMNVDDELTCVCEDPFLKSIELELRKKLYTWKHMRDDIAIEAYINIPMAISGYTYGVEEEADVLETDLENDVVSHGYHDQLASEEDLEKLVFSEVVNDEEESARREAIAHELFDGILEVRMNGIEPVYNLWDKIVTWRGFDNMLFDFLDRPEMMHKLMKKITDISLHLIDQLEEKSLICQPQQRIHCAGAWTDELPQEYNPNQKAKDIWVYGMAQIFSTISPDMHDEFEIEYVKKIYDRFGLVYYGCCEPLDNKIDIVRKLPNVRKIAISPWADQYVAAERIGGDYVFSSKPTPAHLATGWSKEIANKDIDKIMDACEKNGCFVEFLLKDISTVGGDPRRLWEWAEVLRERCGTPDINA